MWIPLVGRILDGGFLGLGNGSGDEGGVCEWADADGGLASWFTFMGNGVREEFMGWRDTMLFSYTMHWEELFKLVSF